MSDWTPPPYADPRAFTEEEVVLAAGGRRTGATLTLPHAPSGHGVVLLTGGGPLDRDETTGPNKPLKDLAWGLASQGVAVLRFDKLTSGHPELMSEPGFTMSAEYVPHGVAAVRLLRQYVDQVFLVGHSMGGKVAPLIATEEPQVDGLVIMAGDTQPMHHAAVRVMRYLRTTNPDLVTDEVVAQFTRQAAVVDSPGLSLDTRPEDLPFGAPPSFWLELLAYNPVETAAALDRPILILQGGRDYQVTVTDDLPAWRDGLANHPAATITILDAVNHLFLPGTGPSTPADYREPGHVDPIVIETILTWLPVATE
ncbi:alpha/beta fold hydrolase [Kribbella monticola]|uniref:alpha/beta fold hydrolase n=1 Tax=Kribbella monticola TaxID=2185285 RepID=UPI000DD42EFB|nr:alpha/beta fold hydrolase [Kribbella monticola]